MLEIDPATLPIDWMTFPHPHSTQAIGDRFVQAAAYLVMKVPSVVVPGDFNYLINPSHSSFSKIQIIGIEPFEFDKRLFIR